MAAESASAAVILTSSHLGFALSTTQVVTGSIVGTGIGKPGGEVRWGIAGRMVVAWMITLRAEGAVGALMWWIGDVLREYAGPLVVVALLVVISSFLYARSRLQRPRNKPAMRSVYTSRRSPTPCPAQKTSPASSPA